MRLRLAVLALVALGSCASISEDACRQGDWRGIGLADGAAGRSETYVQNHAEACAKIGIAPDVARWVEGRREGLALYCTPQNAYDVGQRGSTLNPVCQGYDLAALGRANAQGRQYYEIGQEIFRLEAENAGLDGAIDALLSGEVDDDARRRINGLRFDIEANARRIRSLENQRFGYGYGFL